MLACIQWLRRHERSCEFVVISPKEGRLAGALTSLGIEVIPRLLVGTEATREQIEDELVRAVQFSKSDLLHANSLAMGRLTGRIARRLAIPTTAHLRDILKLSRAAISDLNQNQRLVAVSHATRTHHVAQGLDLDKVVVVHNGIDLTQFHPRQSTGWLHQELQLPRSARLIATIGQIGLRKGQDVLAAAAGDIVREVPDVYFLLIGERSSTKAESVEFEQSILRSFESQQLAQRLHRLGYRDDVLNVMPEIDLIVHPANQEPYGRVLLEAAACGVPVVATDVGGTAEIIVDGATGRLVPPRDPVSLADAVTKLLANKVQLQSMRLAARERAMREFDISRSAEQLLHQWRMVQCRP